MKLYETIIIFQPKINPEEKLKEYKLFYRQTTDHIYLDNIGIKKLAYKSRGFSKRLLYGILL